MSFFNSGALPGQSWHWSVNSSQFSQRRPESSSVLLGRTSSSNCSVRAEWMPMTHILLGRCYIPCRSNMIQLEYARCYKYSMCACFLGDIPFTIWTFTRSTHLAEITPSQGMEAILKARWTKIFPASSVILGSQKYIVWLCMIDSW